PPVATALRGASMPLPVKPKISTFSMWTVFAFRILTPFRPFVAPLIERFRSVTTAVGGLAASLMIIPLVRLARTQANVAQPSIVIPFVIVTAPKPPESIQSISPPAAVFEIAPAKVLQGAVRLHGLTSSPTPETHVRFAWAWAIEAKASVKIAIANIWIVNRNLFIWSLLFLFVGDGRQ